MRLARINHPGLKPVSRLNVLPAAPDWRRPDCADGNSDAGPPMRFPGQRQQQRWLRDAAAATMKFHHCGSRTPPNSINGSWLLSPRNNMSCMSALRSAPAPRLPASVWVARVAGASHHRDGSECQVPRPGNFSRLGRHQSEAAARPCWVRSPPIPPAEYRRAAGGCPGIR